MDIQESVAKVIKHLTFKYPFYGIFLSGLYKEYTKNIPTMGVMYRGINVVLLINPDYFENLSDEHKESVLIHELLHICYMHLNMRADEISKENYDIFNQAADLTINQHIENLPDGFLKLSDFSHLNLQPEAGTLTYYNILLQEKQQQQNNNNGNNESNNDIHSTWNDFNDLNEGQKELIQKQVEYQLKETYQNLKQRGYIPGDLESYIKELFVIKPPVFNWKQYLRRFIQGSKVYYTKRTRSKINIRYPGMPGMKVESFPHILVAVDTSGSVSDKELSEFFSEIYHIWKTGTQVDIVECDAQIHTPYKYNGKFDGKVHGRGGTNFQPVIDYYNQHRLEYNTLVYFTDGECSAPTGLKKNMLWVISSNITQYGREQFDFLPGSKFIIPN